MSAGRPVRAAAVDDAARRSVVPPAAARSLWIAAIWTGLGTALVAATIAIVAVAVCWLPAAGEAGSAGSTVRAGLLTFLSAARGGVTVDGLDAAFLPLGLTVILGVLAWRAGAGLADAADDLAELDPRRLAGAGALQTVSFAVVCAVLARLSPLGTSSVPTIGAFLGSLVLFAIAGGTAFVAHSPLRDAWTARSPGWLAPAARVAAAVVAVYLAAGALLVAGSLVVHHAAVERLSHEVGGGWSGLPVLLLGLLAVPNAAIAGAAYLAGPGFAVGQGTDVALGSAPHGTVPSFPILGAIPHGMANWVGWTLAVLTPLVAGAYAAALARRAVDPWRTLGRAALGVAVVGMVLAWQAGGAIGSGRLHTVGASPWQFGLAVSAGAGAAGAIVLALQMLGDALRDRQAEDPDYIPLAGAGARVSDSVSTKVGEVASVVAAVVHRDRTDKPDGPDEHGPDEHRPDEHEPGDDKLAG